MESEDCSNFLTPRKRTSGELSLSGSRLLEMHQTLISLHEHFETITAFADFSRLKKNLDVFYKLESERLLKSTYSSKVEECRAMIASIEKNKKKLAEKTKKEAAFVNANRELRWMAAEDAAGLRRELIEQTTVLELIEMQASQFSETVISSYISLAKKLRVVEKEKEILRIEISRVDKQTKRFREQAKQARGYMPLDIPFEDFPEELLMKLRRFINSLGIRNLTDIGSEVKQILASAFSIAKDPKKMTPHPGFLDEAAVSGLEKLVFEALEALLKSERLRKERRSKQVEGEKMRTEFEISELERKLSSHTSDLALLRQRARIVDRVQNLKGLMAEAGRLGRLYTFFSTNFASSDIRRLKIEEDVLLYKISEINKRVFEDIFTGLKKKDQLFSQFLIFSFCHRFKVKKALDLFDEYRRLKHKSPSLGLLNDLARALQANFYFSMLTREFSSGTGLSQPSEIMEVNDTSFVSNEGTFRALLSPPSSERGLGLQSNFSPGYDRVPLPDPDFEFKTLQVSLPKLNPKDLEKMNLVLQELIADFSKPIAEVSSPVEKTPSDGGFFEAVKTFASGVSIKLKSRVSKTKATFNPFKPNSNLLDFGFTPFSVKLAIREEELRFTPEGLSSAKKKVLPMVLIRKALVPNNTKDFADQVAKDSKNGLDESGLFEITLLCVNSEKVELLVRSLRMFKLFVLFFETYLKNKSALKAASSNLVFC